MVSGEEDGSGWEVFEEETRLEHVPKFKYSGCMLNESGAKVAEFSRRVESDY